MRLNLDLIPSSSFYNNVRSNVSTSDWDVIRKKCYDRANHTCEICGSNGLKQGYKHKVECHEIWVFNEKEKTQTLTGFVSLCPDCHMVKHFGLAELNGKKEKALAHFVKVNNVSKKDAQRHIDQCFLQWSERSKIQWCVNIEYIEKYLIDDFNQFMRKLPS